MFEGSSLILVMLGVAIAFSVVMLLLSLLVTSLSQTVQALARMRGRNLKSALQSILKAELNVADWKAKQYAAAILNAPEIAPLKQRNDPDSLWSRALGPIVSHIEPAALADLLAHERPADSTEDDAEEEPAGPPKTRILPEGANVDRILDQFVNLERPMGKRFATRMRGVSLMCAILVAGVFQVSTPDLLRRLSTDPDLRAAYASQAGVALELADRVRANETAVIQAALAHTADAHPAMRREIEQTNANVGLDAVLEDLAENIEAYDDRLSAIDTFREFVYGQDAKQLEQRLKDAQDVLSQLSVLEITPWRYGSLFYSEWRNYLGVLLTAILISLGAPFWYSALKKGAAFRDLLVPTKSEPKANGKGTTPTINVNEGTVVIERPTTE